MPSFYPRPLPGHLPLTPPDFVPSYDSRNCGQMQYPQDPYMPQYRSDGREDNVHDYTRGYPQGLAQTNHQAMYNRHNTYQSAQTLPPINSYYDNMGASTLPPLRISDGQSTDEEYRSRLQQEKENRVAQEQQQQQQQQPAAKEEKATGGVSAKLDYEMDRMTDFVAEAAQGIIQPAIPIQPSFRKWVSQVLTATRLPSATILLSLHYLAVRLRDFPRTVTASENQIYRLLAVALILGSKFLDDNTFINRSWSDVSGIRVSELNQLEMEWLHLINYDLHADPSSSTGLSSWLRRWKEHDLAAVNRSRALRLSPLSNNVHRFGPVNAMSSAYQQQQQYAKSQFSDFTPQSTSRAGSAYSTSPYVSADPWNHPEPAAQTAPLYAAHQNFPNFNGRNQSSAMAIAESARRSSNFRGCALPMPYASHSSYSVPWGQLTWGGSHPHGCNCMTCAHQYMSYLPGPGHATQTVVG